MDLELCSNNMLNAYSLFVAMSFLKIDLSYLSPKY
ncbi:MAG: hypothetical protein ACI9Z3_002183, partial [Roseivirga sp.]